METTAKILSPQERNQAIMSQGVKIILPECCKNGDPDCPHVWGKRPKPKKRNVGL